MGRRLFTAPNDLDVLLMVRDARIERLAKYCRDLPPALDRIVRARPAQGPRERFQTAAAFRDALADYLYETGQRVGPPDLRAFLGDLFDCDARGDASGCCCRRASSSDAGAGAPRRRPRRPASARARRRGSARAAPASSSARPTS